MKRLLKFGWKKCDRHTVVADILNAPKYYIIDLSRSTELRRNRDINLSFIHSSSSISGFLFRLSSLILKIFHLFPVIRWSEILKLI